MSSVCVHGLGYIGLPTAAMLANRGHEVVGYDPSESVVERVRRCEVDSDEPGLRSFVEQAFDSGRLSVRATPVPAEYQIICVPTPITDENTADLQYVRAAGETVNEHLRESDTVILESTVPPGTTNEVLRPLLERNGLTAGETFSLAYCPETVLPGNILCELESNNRIIGNIGSEEPTAAVELYETFVEGKINTTDATTAETAKLVQNAHRDVNIAFANEVARLSYRHGVDARACIALANTHPRVEILNPGPGVGGHCLPIDPHFLIEESDEDQSLIQYARTINRGMVDHTVTLMEDVAAPLDRKKVTILGVAYKGGASDTRNSPGLHLAQVLQSAYDDVTIAMVDPQVDDQTLDLQPFDSAIAESDVAVLVTDHDAFTRLTPADFTTMSGDTPAIVDTRGALGRDAFEEAEFAFTRI